MFAFFKIRLSILYQKLKLVSRAFFVIPIAVLLGAVIIRSVTGGSHVVYTALNGRGIFPGPFIYSLLFFVRLTICSIILTFTLQCVSVYRESIKIVLPILTAVVMLLLEYRLIFGGVSILLAILCAISVPFLTMLSFGKLRVKKRLFSVFTAVLFILQFIHTVQLVSLSFCI